jgi:hypothetical protein
MTAPRPGDTIQVGNFLGAVASDEAMRALSADRGDWVIRTDRQTGDGRRWAWFFGVYVDGEWREVELASPSCSCGCRCR